VDHAHDPPHTPGEEAALAQTLLAKGVVHGAFHAEEPTRAGILLAGAVEPAGAGQGAAKHLRPRVFDGVRRRLGRLRFPILHANDQLQAGPGLVHGADLDVHQAERQCQRADDVFGHIG
jgi:hypothetical protein